MTTTNSNGAAAAVVVRVVTDDRSLSEILEIRRRVFILEQRVNPAVDLDGLDRACVQFLASYEGRPAGTCRLRVMRPLVKFQRFAVDGQYRGKGIGQALLDAVADYVRARLPGLLPIATAQLTAARVYEKCGWIDVDDSKIVYEENMAHKIIILPPKTMAELKNLEIMSKSQTALEEEECHFPASLSEIRARLAKLFISDE